MIVFFEIYKFRSMYVETPNLSTEELGNPSNYITKSGKFIRKTSIDELPQLLNILKGEMSIVGPRPALYNQYKLIDMRKELGINLVKPGLTGYAQIKGRDFIADTEKVKMDNFYVDNMSFWLDIKIIFLTVLKVFKSDGVRME